MTAGGEATQKRGTRGRPRSGVRERILATTEAMLNESGIARLSTKEVSKRAGVAESSIFYHFGDRLGLLQALIRECIPLYTEAARSIAERTDQGPFPEHLEALLDALETFYLRLMPISVAIQADGTLRASFAELHRENSMGPQRALRPMTEFLTRERDAGRVDPSVDLHSAALLLTGAAYQRATQRHVTGGDGGLPQMSEIVSAMLPALSPSASNSDRRPS